MHPDETAKRELVDSAALDALIGYANGKRDQSDSQFLAGIAEYEHSEREFEALVTALRREVFPVQPDEAGFMPSEGMITRPHDAAWERLVRGQRVAVSHGDWSSAEMRVTDVIAHYDGGETYVLRDATVTEAQLEAERAAFADAMSSLAFCGDIIKDGCKHVMTGGCPFDCFRGPCRFEREEAAP